MAISIYKAGASNGAVNLKNALGAVLLRSEGSAYRGRNNKLLINWGSSGQEALRLFGLTAPGNRLNNPYCIGQAANKLECLKVLTDHEISTVPWFNNLADALAHSERGRIYARTKLTGSSGEGIRLIMSNEDPQAEEVGDDFPFPVDFTGDNFNEATYARTQLFTVGIVGKRQEWRVHVVKGEVILSQLKMRRQGFEDNEGYTSLVRNVETGWVYSVNFNRGDYQQLDAVQRLAIQAVEALGLDFGAVDIVEKRGEPFVLEVNTAPGLDEEGSALTAYRDAFQLIEQQLLAQQRA